MDEAHHARRRDFIQPQYRPNRLLTLLNGLRERNQYRAVMLLTSEPRDVLEIEWFDWAGEDQNETVTPGVEKAQDLK